MRGPLRVLMVHNYYQQVGGEDFAFENEVHLLRSRGHEVETYVRRNEELEEASRLSAAVGAIWSRNSLNALRQVIQRSRPEVVHFHNTFPLISPSGIFAAKRLDIPVVMTLHNYRLTCAAATHFRDGSLCLDCLGKLVPWPAVVHGCYRRHRAGTTVVAGMQIVHRLAGTWAHKADALIVLSKYMRQVLETGGIPRKQLHIKPNFLPDPGLGRGSRERALFVGRLTPEKGLDTLLSAWQMLPDVPLDIIGSGPLEPQVQSRIERWNLPHVRMIGHVGHEEVLGMIKVARLLVVPSLAFEGLPMTIIEGFACGAPVVCSDIGSLAEMVGPHHAGALFPPGDSEQLAHLVSNLWKDNQRLEQLRQAGRREYEQTYGPAHSYERLMEIYEDILS